MLLPFPRQLMEQQGFPPALIEYLNRLHDEMTRVVDPAFLADLPDAGD